MSASTSFPPKNRLLASLPAADYHHYVHWQVAMGFIYLRQVKVWLATHKLEASNYFTKLVF